MPSVVSTHQDREQLLSVLTENLSGNEEEKTLLRNSFEEAIAQTEPAVIEETNRRIRKRQSQKQIYKIVLSKLPVLAVLFSALYLLTFGSFMVQKYGALFAELSPWGESFFDKIPESFPTLRTKSHLSENDLLFVFGDFEEEIPDAKRATLYRQNPDNISYLSDYLAEKRNPPAEEFKKAIELEPDNGWFKLFYAGILSSEAVVRNDAHRWDEKEPKWKLADAEKLEEALKLLKQVNKDPEFHRHTTTNQKKRISLLPPRQEVFDEVEYITVLGSNPEKDSMAMLRLLEAIIWKARELAKERDSQAFSELTETAFRIIPRSLEQHQSLLGTLIHMTYLRHLSRSLAKAAEGSGFDEAEIDELRILEQEMVEIQRWMKSGVEPKKSPQKYGSVLAALSTTPKIGLGVSDVTQPTVDDWEPSRMKQHLQIEKLYLGMTALALYLAAFLSLVFSKIARKNSKIASLHLEAAFPIRDLLLIIFPSFFLPLILYLLLTRLTPFGCLDWAWRHSEGMPFALHLGLSFYLFLFLPIAISAFLVRSRLHRLRLAQKTTLWNWVPLFCSLIALLAASTFRYFEYQAAIVSAVVATFGFWFWLIRSLLLTWGKKRSFFSRIIGLRLLAISYATLAVLLTFLFKPIEIREKIWVERETYIPTRLSAFHINSLEYHFDQEIRKQLEETMASSLLFP